MTSASIIILLISFTLASAHHSALVPNATGRDFNRFEQCGIDCDHMCRMTGKDESFLPFSKVPLRRSTVQRRFICYNAAVVACSLHSPTSIFSVLPPNRTNMKIFFAILLLIALVAAAPQQKCGQNEVWGLCGNHCELTCIPTGKECEMDCKPAACKCDFDFYRHKDGRCVQKKDC